MVFAVIVVHQHSQTDDLLCLQLATIAASVNWHM